MSASAEAVSSWQKRAGRACISPTRLQEMDSRWSWHLGHRGSGARTYLSWVSCAERLCIQVMTWRRSLLAEGLHASARAAEMLGTFLDILGLERVYLASQAVSWHMALHFALH